MKDFCKRNILPAAVVLLGIFGYSLRSGLYAVAVDHKNLLVRGHPLEIALWACTAAAVLAAVLDGAVWQSRKSGIGALIGGLGHILAAAGILMTVLGQNLFLTPIMQMWKVAGMISAALLCLAGLFLAMGKRPLFVSYVAGSVFFALHLIGHYQSWCADPQLQNYVFSFLGGLFLMMISYFQAAALAGMGKIRLQRLSCLLALYCCLAAIANTQYLILYFSCGIWAVSCLCIPEFTEPVKVGEDDVPA